MKDADAPSAAGTALAEDAHVSGSSWPLDWDTGAVRTLSDRIAETVREAIIRGDLPPGRALRQVELSRRLRVSFAPLREAMRQLEAEGFVRFMPFHGAIVAPLETDELRDFADILLAIETLAARSAAQHMTPELLGKAECAFQDLAKEPDNTRLLGLTLRIRLTLYSASGRRRLIELIRMVRLNSHRWARQLYSDDSGRSWAIGAIRGLIDAFRTGDPEAPARQIIESYREAAGMLERAAAEQTRRAHEGAPDEPAELTLPPAGGRRRPATRRTTTRAAARRSTPRGRAV
jgi:DNA-binding GntR family transcriptional regulator